MLKYGYRWMLVALLFIAAIILVQSLKYTLTLADILEWLDLFDPTEIQSVKQMDNNVPNSMGWTPKDIVDLLGVLTQFILGIVGSVLTFITAQRVR